MASEINRKIHIVTVLKRTHRAHTVRILQLSTPSLEKRKGKKKPPQGLSWKDEGFLKQFTDSCCYSLMGDTITDKPIQ